MLELKAQNIFEASAKAAELVEQWATPSDENPYCWFRGVSDKNYRLVPGAHWRNFDEIGPLTTFSQEGGAFANVGGIDEWDTYYLAQHYGLPTRLLDWTESFNAALFFALDGWVDKYTEPCIYLLRPYELNRISINWPGIISPNNYPEETGIWLPRAITKGRAVKPVDTYTYDNEKPIAIYPRKSNNRLIAQMGVFTVHGRSKNPLDDYLRSENVNVDNILGRIVLSGANVSKCRRDLERLGVRRSTIYPDMINFVSYLKEIYRW